MKLLHTSDWHLGRQLHGVSLLEDQAHVLEQIVDIARAKQVDVVVVAGDIYDRAVPPAEAVTLLNQTLQRLCVELGKQVVVISGNHDSGERLGFAAQLLAGAGLHIVGELGPQPCRWTFTVDGHAYDIFGLPYAGPNRVRQVLAAEVSTHEHAMASLLAQVEQAREPDRPTIVVAHCFVDGGEESESERPLSLGGADKISAGLFRHFDYVALGHLHGRQYRGSEHIRYSGSILKYSFSEVNHQKSVSLVDISPAGDVRVDNVALNPLRELRIVEGSLDDLLRNGATDSRRDDFIQARVTDTEALLDVMAKLRAVYPNILQLQLTGLAERDSPGQANKDLMKKQPMDLFAEFFADVQGDDLTDAQRAYMATIVDQLQAEGVL